MRLKGFATLRPIVGYTAVLAVLIYLIAVCVHTCLWWSSYADTTVSSGQLLQTLIDTEFILALAYAFVVMIVAIAFLRRGWRGSLKEGLWMGGLIGAFTPLALVDIDFLRTAITATQVLSDGEYGMMLSVVLLSLAVVTLPFGLIAGAIVGTVVQKTMRS